jgi:hypothetical protein
MKRKTIVGLIAVAAVIAVAMLAGCIDEPAPTSIPATPKLTPTSTPKLITSTPKPTMAAVSTAFDSDKAALLTVKTKLSNQNFRDVNVQVADGRAEGGVKALMVSYNTIATTEADVSYETGAILGAYIGSINGGADFDELMVIVGDRNGLAAGMWHCNKDWTNGYIDGRLSKDELLLNVLSTMTGL